MARLFESHAAFKRSLRGMTPRVPRSSHIGSSIVVKHEKGNRWATVIALWMVCDETGVLHRKRGTPTRGHSAFSFLSVLAEVGVVAQVDESRHSSVRTAQEGNDVGCPLSQWPTRITRDGL